MNPANEKPAPAADHESGRDLTSQVLNLLRSPEFQDEIQFLVRDAVRAISDELGNIELERENGLDEAARAFRSALANAKPLPGYHERMANRRAELAARAPSVPFRSIPMQPGGDQP